MDILIIIAILFYMLSTAAYIAFLFLQKNVAQRVGYFLVLAGFLSHTATIIVNFIKIGHLPAGNLSETLSLAGWTIAGGFLIFQYRFNLKILGILAVPMITLIMVLATLVPSVPYEASKTFKNFWLIAHVLAIFFGEAFFTLAAGLGVLFLLQENAIKAKRHQFFFKRLPSLDSLDSTGYACIVVGFTMLTLGLITGLIYAKTFWGRFWSWDPKEVWSAITWIFYAVLLHERLTVGWRGRKSAIMAIIGFGVLVFTFLGVNLLLEGHHGEFTR